MKRGALWLALVLCAVGSGGCGSGNNKQGIYTQNYTFYANGVNSGGLVYSIAGVVTIGTSPLADGSFAVLGGEQDYNDGHVTTVIDDLLTGGKLVKAADGSATLTLVTTSKIPGVMGTETLAVFFSNANHALITEIDGSATSSGSLDLQPDTAQSIPSGSYSFVASGADTNLMPIVYGGVWTVDPMTAAVTGILDVNDAGNVVTNTPIAAGPAFMAPDSLGRGIVMGSAGIGTSLVYYIVGPEVIRLIDVDTTDTAVGSAYSQGVNPAPGPASIGTSVLSIGSSVGLYAAVGQLVTASEIEVPAFNGVGDENESVLNGNAPELAESFDGTYTVGGNGYGALNFNDSLGSISVLGVYVVDPLLNILDPNSSTGLGGALVAEMDPNLVGIGIIVPQTDVSTGSFSGSYIFGAQGETGPADEFDFSGVGTATALSFTGTGALSDPFGTVTAGVESETATFKATAAPDSGHPGRYTLNPLAVGTTGSDFAPFDFKTVTAYQASGERLFWLEVDAGSVFLGSLQQN
ncbi:MAG: hypothetical protein WCD49_09645 [Candidatus Acidiferrales bacterium]